MVQPRNASSVDSRWVPGEMSVRSDGEVAGSALIPVADAGAERPMAIRTLHGLSKFELEAKLDITRAGSARELAERAGSYGGAGGAEIGVIEYVEKLGPEFQVHLLGDRISLNHSDIPLLDARSDQYIAAGIPKARRPIGQSLRQCGGR